MGSYSTGKAEVVEWIRKHFPDGTILDVGACDGCWRHLLPEYTMDAVEIFPPNAMNLSGYRDVICADVCDIELKDYDLIIFGDVIEHMTVEKAQGVLARAREHCKDMIVAVPFLYVQGAIYGNPWERHIQDDLTAELFAERYPGFEPIFSTADYCYYHKEEKDA